MEVRNVVAWRGARLAEEERGTTKPRQCYSGSATKKYSFRIFVEKHLKKINGL